MMDFCVELDNNPENLVLIGELLGAAGVNIEGLCLTGCDDRSVIHFVVEDEAAARNVLGDAGINISAVTEVYILSKDQKRVTGKPGSFGEICRTLADNGIEINFGYPAENNRFVFGVDDVAKVRGLLERFMKCSA